MKKILVITGTNRDVDFATIELFAEQGYQVISLSQYPLTLNHTIHLTVDLADICWPHIHGDSLQALLQGSESVTLVHNASLMPKNNVVDINNYELHKMLQLNIIASTQLNQLVLPMMKPGSCILYMSFTHSEKTVADTYLYVMSRNAQMGLMQATSEDLITQGIHTACICPGLTDTQTRRHKTANNQEILSHFSNQTSIERFLSPKEIANTVMFCSQNISINGSVMHVN